MRIGVGAIRQGTVFPARCCWKFQVFELLGNSGSTSFELGQLPMLVSLTLISHVATKSFSQIELLSSCSTHFIRDFITHVTNCHLPYRA